MSIDKVLKEEIIEFFSHHPTKQSARNFLTRRLSQSEARGREEERKMVIGEIKDNLAVIKKGTTGAMRTAISSIEAMWALHTDPAYKDIYKSSKEFKEAKSKAEIDLVDRIIAFRSQYIYDKYSSLGQQDNKINAEYFTEEGKLLEKIKSDLLTKLGGTK